MFWSSSPSSSSSGETSASASTPPSPASSSASSATSQSPGPATPPSSTWSSDGPAGLGVISSLSPECTPLKRRYDSCFDRWFTDYLAIGDAQILEQQRQGSEPASQAADSIPKKKKSSWFGSPNESTSSSSSATGGGLFSSSGGLSADPELERKKKEVMERYDRDCGKLFREYRDCVKRAASEKGLDSLIADARAENPFPFDHERQKDGRDNNPPFPFPAARRQED